MIKVICISSNDTLICDGLDYYIEYRGEYKAEETSHKNYYSIQLKGDLSNYFVHIPKYHFITLAEWRAKQIDEILND